MVKSYKKQKQGTSYTRNTLHCNILGIRLNIVDYNTYLRKYCIIGLIELKRPLYPVRP